jgi:hypothetical protein
MTDDQASERPASQQPMVNRIFPRNLTAEAAYHVLGNPPSTRPESGVANCFPGLEYDHRNLDRRFFPGLQVVYVEQGDTTQGVRVVAVDPGEDILVRPPAEYASIAQALGPQLSALSARLSATTPWFVSALDQAGTRIELVDDSGANLAGSTAWRLVRSLRPGPVTLFVTQRPAPPAQPPAPPDQLPRTIRLDGWRRSYTDPRSGVLDTAYQPGELTQSLCSPWTHDFRDCSCTYWASNHPDIVFPAVPRGARTQPSGAPTDPAEEIRINWLRDPDVAEVHGQALPSQPENRPFEASYFQINQRWQDFSIVLEGRETEGSYVPRSAARDQAVPFATSAELRDRIVQLAGLEHLVTLLYLYALFSVIEPAQAQERGAGRWPTLSEDVTFTRSVLLEVATGEMQHLRWANHLLWGLAEAIGHPFEPAVVPPALVLPGPPGGDGRPAQLAPLTRDTLALFVDIERSSAYIDGQYARVTATLRQPGYPAHLYQLASNIAEEGEEHFLNFRDLQRLLAPYGEKDPVYLRPVSPGDPAQPEVRAALDTYQHILTLLETGYQLGDRQNQKALAEARTAMFDLQSRAEQLARQGHGIPFFAPWQ